MEKETKITNIYNNGSSVPSQKYSPEAKRKQKKPNYKISFHNQNLDEAIKNVQTHIKQNPQWKLNVEAVTSQYQSKSKISNLNSGMLDEQKQLQLNKNIQLKINQPETFYLQQDTQPKKKLQIDFEKYKFTERQKRQFDQRMKQIKERRMRIDVELLEKQMGNKLQKKIKQNLLLKQKMESLKDIQQKRSQNINLRRNINKRVSQQQSLLHQQAIAKVEMLRRSKRKSKKIEINQNKSLSQESFENLRFKSFLMDKQKEKTNQILGFRNIRLRTASQSNLRRGGKNTQIQSIGTNRMKSSQSHRNIQKTSGSHQQ